MTVVVGASVVVGTAVVVGTVATAEMVPAEGMVVRQNMAEDWIPRAIKYSNERNGVTSIESDVVAFVLAAAFAGSLADHADNIGETIHQRNISDLIIQCLQ